MDGSLKSQAQSKVRSSSGPVQAKNHCEYWGGETSGNVGADRQTQSRWKSEKQLQREPARRRLHRTDAGPFAALSGWWIWTIAVMISLRLKERFIISRSLAELMNARSPFNSFRGGKSATMTTLSSSYARISLTTRP